MTRFLVLFFSILIIAGCGEDKKAEVKTEETVTATETTVQLTDDQMKNAGIATGKLELKNISAVLKVNGTIDVPPQNIVSVSVPLGGYLRSTRLLPGMHVSKGQSIATLEDPQYIQLQQDYLTAKAKLVYAEQEYNRQKELNQSKASSDKVLQQAQAELTSQNIMVRSLAEKLRLININPDRLSAGTITRSISIFSPINGFVSKVNVNIGKYSNPSDVLFEIINPADIHLALDVFEKDVNKLFTGQKLLAYTNTNPTKKYPCKIILIGKDFSADRAVEVHAHFESYDKTLIPGTFMNAEIETQNSNAYVLPSDAIVTYENKQYVFVEKGKNIFEITEVITGSTQNGFTQITDEAVKTLTDKKIVVSGAYNLLMKMKNTSDE
jgi:membrane fusion protein, heavy metal efflux system